MPVIRNFAIRLIVVCIVAVFPAMLIGLVVPAIISAAQFGIEQSQPPPVIDLSGPKTVRTCPPGTELQAVTDTRPNYNRNGIVTTVSYFCTGPDGTQTKPTETIESVSNSVPSLSGGNFFFSSGADKLRLLAYPVSFGLILVVSFFVRMEPSRKA
jgi:hypothetical protein